MNLVKLAATMQSTKLISSQKPASFSSLAFVRLSSLISACRSFLLVSARDLARVTTKNKPRPPVCHSLPSESASSIGRPGFRGAGDNRTVIFIWIFQPPMWAPRFCFIPHAFASNPAESRLFAFLPLQSALHARRPFRRSKLAAVGEWPARISFVRGCRILCNECANVRRCCLENR